MTDFIQYSILPTESGIILVELNTQTMTFRKIISNDDIMEAKTRPKYNEFLKEWSEKNKITSFFGSDKAEFLQDWNNVKTGGGAKKAEPVVEAVAEPIVSSPEVRGTKKTIIFSEAEKRKMDGMTRDQRINYGIKISRKDKEINTVVENDLFDFAKELRSGRTTFEYFFKGINKGSVTPQNKYFKMGLLRTWLRDNNKHINNIDKMLVGELDKALEVRGIDVNELFKIGKKYYEENPIPDSYSLI